MEEESDKWPPLLENEMEGQSDGMETDPAPSVSENEEMGIDEESFMRRLILTHADGNPTNLSDITRLSLTGLGMPFPKPISPSILVNMSATFSELESVEKLAITRGYIPLIDK
jgi:hypothetical protein